MRMAYTVFAGAMILFTGCTRPPNCLVKTVTPPAPTSGVALIQTQKQEPSPSKQDVVRKGYAALCQAQPDVKWQARPFSVQETDVRWVLTFVPTERGKGPQSYIIWVDKASGEAKPVGSR